MVSHTSPASELVHSAFCRPSRSNKSEIVVIGSGPGGSISAALLAEAGREVTLIEEGEHHPQGKFGHFSAAELEACYRSGGMTSALGSRPINYVEACCLGGGSEVNSGLYHRIPQDVAERWSSRHKVQEFEYDKLLALQETNEKDLSIAPAPGEVQPASQLLEQGARKNGWACGQVQRWHKYERDYRPLAPGGTRQSMSEVYLPRLARAGGRIVKNCRARRLTFTAGSWRVETQLQGRPVYYRARHVFVAAGAVNSPALLRASGFKGRVGDKLRMHVFARVIAQFDREMNSAAAGIGPHQIEQFAPRIRLGCAASSPQQLALALAQSDPGWLASHAEMWKCRAAYYASVGSGSGHVRVLPGGQPVVFYRLTRAECYDLADGIRALCKALFAAGATRILPVMHAAPTLTCAGQLWKLPRPLRPEKCNFTSVHLMGSCPMGDGGATDSFGHLKGASGLIVADASLFCDSPNLNPQGTVMTLARRNTMRFIETVRASA